MQWRTLIALSAALGVTFTVFEIVLAGHRQDTLIEDMAAYYRIVASTAVTIALLCLICGLVGSLFHRFVGLTRSQAAVAGVLAPSVPLAVYLGGVNVRWNHDQDWIWFVVGIPAAFACASGMIRARRSRIEEAIGVVWPAVAPVACWTMFAQSLNQGPTFFRQAIWLLAVTWTLGAAAIILAVRFYPKIGHTFSVAALASVLLAALVTPLSLDFDRPDTLVSTADQDSPPVILLTVDTLRRDALSLYGSETPTPAIDSLGADGVVFDGAYSTAPWTYISFTSIHSGVTPWAHGVRRAVDRLSPRTLALAPAMRDHGYSTAAIGKNLLLTAHNQARAIPQVFSDLFFFERIVSPRTRAQSILASLAPSILGLDASTTQLGEYGSEWVRNHGETPFFLWLHFFDPHAPYDLVAEFPPDFEPPAELRELTGRPHFEALKRGRRYPGLMEWSRALYQSEVQAVDQAIGGFLDTLKQQGLYDRALIIFSSDHGEEFAEHNGYLHAHSLYNELVRVPLIVKLPNSETTLRLAQPVSTVAIAPTIFDLASVPYDEELYSASSLRNTWQESRVAGPSAPVFMTGVNSAEPAEAVVWENYKYICWQNIHHEELYDIETDPKEQYNLALRMPEQVAIGKALLADHAAKEVIRAKARGFGVPEQAPLTPEEERILRGLGYLQ